MEQTITANKAIEIKGARVHNLKNIDLELQRNKFIVITGVSGSGKSSLAFDTLYAEGQRRYVESLSSYARQFLGKINKPEVDYIKGIPPAIAIEQKVNTRNPHSTVGTSTEIYDYMKLLYARIGRTFSPISGKEIKQHTVTTVVDFALENAIGKRLMVLSDLPTAEIDLYNALESLLKQGFSRVDYKGETVRIDKLKDEKDIDRSQLFLLIDRVKMDDSDETINRLSDSVQTAFYEGSGKCFLRIFDEDKNSELYEFSNLFEADGIKFEEPSIHLFTFNNPIGACPTCEGFGKVLGIDPDLVIPNKNLSVYEDAVACWKGEKMSEWKNELIYNAEKFNFPIHRPYHELSDENKELLWTGNKHFGGINDFFKMVEDNLYKVQYRVMLSRYRGRTTCPDCNGARLRKEAQYVKIGGKAISELVDIPILDLKAFFDEIDFTEQEKAISKRLIHEIRSRIDFMINVGLEYLTLNRLSSTLSGGESQRINLATSLGSSLVGSLYILDEPSIGLHSKDTQLLIGVLKRLQSLGNTVVVVEHDEDIMKAADEIIDIGPRAGIFGGELVFKGDSQKLESEGESLTAEYLTGKRQIEVPQHRRNWNNAIKITGARENNLRNISASFPLNVLTVVTGVSGSGKSTLVRQILYPALSKHLGGYGERTGEFERLEGEIDEIKAIEFVDQNPIGKSSRSNPVTYSKAYDEIRKLYSEQQASKINGFKPTHFSFNIAGGRCEECQGDGFIKVEMQFMADIILECESCKGKRFKDEVLEVEYQGKNIYDVLDMSVDEAIDFFGTEQKPTQKRIVSRLKTLQDVGLGYVKLGQSSSTLSGGESQRVKLASFLGKESRSEHTLFIFDEPTTGLHFHDIVKLLKAFNSLIEKGHSIIVVEHNMDVIKAADWIIDLGPEGGNKGGELVFQGKPEDIIKCEKSFTGKFLEEKLK